MIQKKEENGEKYVTASDEAEFHEALNRGLAVELTRELAGRSENDEDVGTVARTRGTTVTTRNGDRRNPFGGAGKLRAERPNSRQIGMEAGELRMSFEWRRDG